MPNSTDEKTTTKTLYEQLATTHPWLANELKENKLFYLYAAVFYATEDAYNLACSFFSLGYAMNDAFHERSDRASATEWHLYEITLEGLIVTIVGSLLLMAFSSLGTYYADADPVKDGLFYYYLGVLWPYFRDALKAMKWEYKGVRSTLTLILMLSNHLALLYHILFPVTLVLGLLAVINRILIRYMRNERKKSMKENDALCLEIIKYLETSRHNSLNVLMSDLFNWGQIEADIKTRIKYQSTRLVIWCYCAVVYSALIDSLYFYMGVLFVSALNPHLFFALMAMSFLLFVSCMVYRVYEEFDFQRKLHRTQIGVEITLVEAKSQLILLALSKEGADKTRLLTNLVQLMDTYQALLTKLEEKTLLSPLMIFLESLKSGLAFQGVISALMFLVIAILAFSSTSCPPVLVFAFMSVGIAAFFLAGIQFGVSYRHYLNTLRARQARLKEDLGYSPETWHEEYDNLQTDEDRQAFLAEIGKKIHRCSIVPNNTDDLAPITQFDLLNWWEVLRQLFAGIVKAIKTYGELTYDHTGAHDESPTMFVVSLLFFALMGIIFACRTVAKFFTPADPPVPVAILCPETEKGEAEESARPIPDNSAHASSIGMYATGTLAQIRRAVSCDGQSSQSLVIYNS